jgi:hypothetical protein
VDSAARWERLEAQWDEADARRADLVRAQALMLVLEKASVDAREHCERMLDVLVKAYAHYDRVLSLASDMATLLASGDAESISAVAEVVEGLEAE